MIDPNTAMSAAGEGAKAISKFEEIVQKLFGPRWTKKQADADAYADEKKLQTIRNNPDMEIIYLNGQMSARERTPEALAFRAGQRQLAELTREQDNLEKVLEIAGEQLQFAEDVSDEPVDGDWLARFFNISKDIGTAEMQFIWGKILAGEIVNPGNFSLRTLETIRNISADEAQIFELILPYVVSSGAARFIPTNAVIDKENEILYGHIMQMDECGLINSGSVTTLGFKVPPKCENVPILDIGKEVLLISNPVEIEFSADLPVYPLTRSAIELMKILAYVPNKESFYKWADWIHSSHCPCTRMIFCQIESSDESGNLKFDTENPIFTICPIPHIHEETETISEKGIADVEVIE